MKSSDVTALFAIKVLTPIASPGTAPTYASIQLAHKELSANAAGVPSHEGGGRFGHLALTMTPEQYLARAQVAFKAPILPESPPEFGANAKAGQISEENRAYDKAVSTFDV